MYFFFQETGSQLPAFNPNAYQKTIMCTSIVSSQFIRYLHLHASRTFHVVGHINAVYVSHGV